MLKKPLISIILPIYNEKPELLSRCIDSILINNYENFELILSNDGSDSYIYDLCQKYISNSNNIKYIENKNSGVSCARNLGILAATGEYIAFVDSDDTIEKDMYAKLLKAISEDNADVAICSIKYIYPNYKYTIDKFISQHYVGDDILNLIIYPLLGQNLDSMPMHASACRCLYSTKLLNDNNILFQNIKFSEDLLFNLNVFFNATRVVGVNDTYYNYICNTNSVTNKYNINRFNEIIKAFDSILDLLSNFNVDNTIVNTRLSNWLISQLSVIVRQDIENLPYSKSLNNIKFYRRHFAINNSLNFFNATSPFSLKLFNFLLKNKYYNILYIIILIYIKLKSDI